MKSKRFMAGKWRRGIVPALFLVILILLTVKINQTEKIPLVETAGYTFEKGVVTQIIEDNIDENGTRVGEQKIMVRMTTGEKKGQELETTSSAGYLFGAACTVGMHVVVMQSVSGDTVITTVYAQDREMAVYIFAALYLLALIVIGGKKGLRGALGLVFTFVCVILIEIPLLYRGYSPYLVTIVICVVTTLVTMYFIGGATRKTVCATLGTTAGVVIASIAAKLFGMATGLSGWNVSTIESLLDLWYTGGIQVGELLFSGLLISALGAVMDVAMSVTSSMQEVLVQNPKLSRKELFRSGMRVGRDMMGTDSNTLILAFAGTSISTLLLDCAYDLPYRQIINSNIIGLDIMQGLSGSFGVVLAVPVTVLVGSLLLRAPQEAKAEEAVHKEEKTAAVEETATPVLEQKIV